MKAYQYKSFALLVAQNEMESYYQHEGLATSKNVSMGNYLYTVKWLSAAEEDIEEGRLSISWLSPRKKEESISFILYRIPKVSPSSS